ncbi:unnamed protein product [Gordionus sp. m RMFG-2023]
MFKRKLENDMPSISLLNIHSIESFTSNANLDSDHSNEKNGMGINHIDQNFSKINNIQSQQINVQQYDMSTLPLTIQSIKSNKDIYITPNKGDNLSRENAKSMNIFTKIFTNHHLISNTSLKDITKNLFINHKIINPPLNSYHLTSINGSKISAHSNNSLPFDSYEEYKGVNKDALDEGLELAWMGQKLSQRQHYTEAITLFNKSLSFLLNSKYDIIFTSNDCKDNVTNNDNIVNNVENQVTYMDTLGRGYKIEEILSAQFQIDQIFITSYSPQLIQILNAIYSHLGNCHYFLRQNNMAFECHIRDLRLTM